MCKGYGLSLFDSLSNALLKYKTEFTRRRKLLQIQFIEDKGESIATVQVAYSDGVASEPEPRNYGHFTFYEYENINLKDKVSSFFNIFDTDGKFVN